jgi:DNA-binding NarL/FixJ family response regulator
MSSQSGSWMSLGRVGLPLVTQEGAPLAGPTRVVILGEDALARSALVNRLAGHPHVSVIAHAAAEAAVSAVIEHEPDVVLWDLGLHGGTATHLRGGGGAAGLRAWDGGVPVLALSDAGAGPELIHAGAQGVLGRDTSGARLSAALVAVAHDLRVSDAAVEPATPRLLATPDAPPEALTPREREVVNLLAQGLSNKAIGERLAISEHTAKFHVNAILGKLGASGRTDAVMRAVRLGLILV